MLTLIVYGQGSQKLYNWPKILSPPHYRNGVHQTVEIYVCIVENSETFKKILCSLSEPILFHWCL